MFYRGNYFNHKLIHAWPLNMSEKTSEQEPSIEEILASIRQIISDDDEEETPAPAKKPVVKAPEKPREKPVEVLELTEEDLIEPEDEEDEPAPFDLEMRDRAYQEESIEEPEEEEPEEEYFEPAPPPVERPRKPVDRATVPSDILSSATQSAALGSLAKLATKMPINSSRAYDGITLEDIVREMLHPMLREWMDDNLAPMVERTVQKELEKLARRAMDD